MTLIIIRHGESVNNLEDKSRHTLDPNLTPLGLAQAKALGERCAAVHLDYLVASPLPRSLRTANEIAVRKHNMPVHVLHELVEIGTDYRTLTHAQALAVCPSVLPYDAKDQAGDYGDNYELEIRDPYYSMGRAYRVISRVRQSFGEDAVVALVGHGAFNQRLIAAALRTAFPPHFIFGQSNTGVSVVNWRPDGEGNVVTRLVMMNDTSHLYKAGIPG